MGEATERLTGMRDRNGRYDYSFADVRETQVAAVDERFAERRGEIKLLAHRAEEAGIGQVRDHADMVPLLFPHTAYKSYPEGWLMEGRWDRLAKWLDTVSTYRVPVEKVKGATDMDDWIGRLGENGFHVSCSSGTTGKSAMLVASDADMDWVAHESLNCLRWSSGIEPLQDRRMFGLGAVAMVPRNLAGGRHVAAAYADPSKPRFDSGIPPITIGGITDMVVLRKKIADGTARPEEVADYEDVSATRAKAMEDAVGLTADALIAARHDKIHLAGLWGGVYPIAKAVRDRGYSAKDFNAENSIYNAGGLKRAALPEGYAQFVFDTFNIQPHHVGQNYSMQELHSGMPKCQAGQRYHIPPWVVPLILDKSGDTLLPITGGEYEGRAAFFDLSIDGRWGGVISGDKVSIDFGPCACGNRGPSLRDNVSRYADIEGDDKIGCAGTVDAYVRGVS